MKKISMLSLLILLTLISSVFTPCGNASLELWSQTYGSETEAETANSLVETSDGGYAMAGGAIAIGLSYDFWLVKTDRNGSIQWNQSFGGTEMNAEIAQSLVEAADGGYTIAGGTHSFGAGSYDCWLVKTDANGNTQWNKTYGGQEWDEANSLVETSDGGYAMAGRTESFGAGSSDFWVIRTDSNGNIIWEKTYGGTMYETANSLVETTDGGYAITGSTTSFGAGNFDFWLIKTEANGKMQWNQTYGGTEPDYAHSLVETSDGGYAIAGRTESFGAGKDDFWLIKTDKFGNMEWNQTYGGTESDRADSLVVASDGGYTLAGNTYSFGAGSYDFWLVKTDGLGNIEWNQTYGGAGDERANSLVKTSDGGYGLAGYTLSHGNGNMDFLVIKTDNNGIIPEFPSWIILPMFLITTVVIVFCKKKVWRRPL